MYLTLSDAADDRLIVGSDVGNGYAYTDLVYGIPVLLSSCVLTLSDAADDRLIVGSDVGNGYPYTDLVYGIPVLSSMCI